MGTMRTTLSLDADIYAELERRRREGAKLKPEINRLLRLGIRYEEEQARAAPQRRGPYTTPSNLGEFLFPVDDVEAVIAYAEGEDHK